MKPKILFVVGAYPDVGKGVFSSSLGYLLQELGCTVSPLKFDGHFNTSQGSLFPYHDKVGGKGYFGEEVFVTTDGFVCGIDTSNYEKFLHCQLSNRHNITTGRLFRQCIEGEESGKFARMVVNYRHLRSMLVEWLLAQATNDILIVEGGGSVGDRELDLLFEAMSEIKASGAADVQTILLSPYFWKDTGGAAMSYKSKVTRQAFEKAWRLGVRPDMVVLRTDAGITPSPMDIGYIAAEGSLNADDDVFINADQASLFTLPEALHEQGLDRRVLKGFSLSAKGAPTGRIAEYSRKLESVAKSETTLRVGLFGNNASFGSFASLLNAVENAAVAEGVRTETVWLDDAACSPEEIGKLHAIVLGEGLGRIEDRLTLLRTARDRDIPCLAFAFGFDLFVKEFVESVVGKSVAIEELGEDGDLKITTTELRTGGIALAEQDPAIQWSSEALERVRTNSSLNEALRGLIRSSELSVLAAAEEDGEPLALRLPSHSFLVAVKYHPEYLSHPGYPHPLFVGLLRASRSS